jgi:hypothetical protein
VAEFILDQHLLDTLCRRFGGDATHDVLEQHVAHGRVIADPTTGALLITDPAARTSAHAVAVLILSIRQRSWRIRLRSTNDTIRLTGHLTDPTTRIEDDDAFADPQLRDDVHQAVDELGDAAYRCLVAYYLDRRSTAEISAGEGISLTATRKRLQRARDELATNSALRELFDTARDAT